MTPVTPTAMPGKRAAALSTARRTNCPREAEQWDFKNDMKRGNH